MSDTTAPAQTRERSVPLLVWILTAIFALRAFITVVGAFLFAFPMGGMLGVAVGLTLLAIGVAYLVIAWRMRFGERAIWLAAIVVPLINQAVLTVADLSLYGSIPPEDYAFIVVTVVVLGLLFVPSVRRFFAR
ncbi:MAG: hypothetical protein ACRDGB_10315 [Candidatus Limnocylindria bacterium]